MIENTTKELLSVRIKNEWSSAKECDLHIGDVKEIQTINSFGSLVTDAGKRDREFQRHIYIAQDVFQRQGTTNPRQFISNKAET